MNNKYILKFTGFLILLIMAIFHLFKMNVYAKDELVVVIDPGHGGFSTEGEKDLGASYDGVYEKEVDLITARALYEELSQYGNVKIFLTRNEDMHMELQERADIAASVNADIFISVHYNASAHHRFYGTEIFTSAYGEEYAKGFSLAKDIERYWVDNGNISKGVKVRLGNHGDYYGVIRMCKEYGIPALILEHGYLDNDKDFERLNTKEAWEKMGRLDAEAIADHFGLEKGVNKEKINDELNVEIPEDHVNPDDTPPENVLLSFDSFDPVTGKLEYTVKASESDSVLMYYALDTEENAADEDLGFMDLCVWDKDSSVMKGTYYVPEGYVGSFVARVYNNYEKYTDTDPMTIPEDLFKEGSVETEEESEEEQIYPMGEDFFDEIETSEKESPEERSGEDQQKNITSYDPAFFFGAAVVSLLVLVFIVCLIKKR